MTTSTKSLIALGIVGAYGLGVWTAPQVRDLEMTTPTEQVEVAEAPAPRDASRAPRSRDRADAPAPEIVTLSASAEPVRNHVRPLLTWGTDTNKAAEGFSSAEQFVTLAYAAKNTQVPFILLKHRVLNEKQSLESAIRASKPELDASLEADRARLEARADLARFSE